MATDINMKDGRITVESEFITTVFTDLTSAAAQIALLHQEYIVLKKEKNDLVHRINALEDEIRMLKLKQRRK